MLKIFSKHTKPNAIWVWEDDTLDDIFHKLEVEHEVRPDLEDYGNHINYTPKWTNPEVAEKYKGCVMIFSSPYVRLITDEKKLIERCAQAINEYKKTEEYQEQRKNYLKNEEEKERIHREMMMKKKSYA